MFNGQPDYNSRRDSFSPTATSVKATLPGAVRLQWGFLFASVRLMKPCKFTAEERSEKRYCAYCGKLLVRKSSPCGAKEAWKQFLSRKHCNNTCRGLHDRQRPPMKSASHYRARVLKPEGPCESCGSGEKTQVHHVDGDPFNNSIDNLQRLCLSCHGKTRGANECRVCGKNSIQGYGLCSKHYMRHYRHGNVFVDLRRKDGTAA